MRSIVPIRDSLQATTRPTHPDVLGRGLAVVRSACALALSTLIFSLLVACPINLVDGCDTNADCVAPAICLDARCQVTEPACVIDSDCNDPDLVLRDGQCESALPIGDGDGDGDGDGMLTVDPTSLDFGAPIFGGPVDRELTLSNTGTGPLTVDTVRVKAGTSDEFTVVTDDLPQTLGPQESTSVVVRYTLADAEADSGAVEVLACSTPPCPEVSATVALTSAFVGTKNLSVSPLTADFGYVPNGQESSAISLVFSNTASDSAVLTVESLLLSGSTTQFTVEAPSLPLFIAPNASVEIPITYAPDLANNDAELTVTVNADSDSVALQQQTATFSGTSEEQIALVFDPVELVFNELSIGQTAQLSATLHNVSGTPVQVSGMTLGPQNPVEYSFFASVTLPYTIGPEGSITVFVDYDAQAGESTATTLTVQNDQASGDTPVLSIRGDSFVPAGGPILDVVASPVTVLDSSCQCAAAPGVPAANVDLTYRVLPAGGSCGKPANPACGIGGTCDCPALDTYGEVNWSSAYTEQVRGETWIIDEKVHHEGSGPDASFMARVSLVDDCLAVPGSTNYSLNYTCCESVDCPGAQTCYQYGQAPDCAIDCQVYAFEATSQDCLQRGPIMVRVRVDISGGNDDESHHYCVPFSQSGVQQDVVSLVRQQGAFQTGTVQAGVTEVDPQTPCPSP